MAVAAFLSGRIRFGRIAEVIGNRAVDRLTAVKAVAGDFIERRNGDRIGLILFGTQAYQQAPLAFDRATVGALRARAAGHDVSIRSVAPDKVGAHAAKATDLYVPET